MKIKSGYQRKYKFQDHKIIVFYSSEFVKRLAGRSIDHDIFLNKLYEAFPKLVEISYGDPKFEAIIKSQTTKINIVVSVASKENRINLIVETVMVKEDFITTRLKDYEIWVSNPLLKISFEPKTDKLIKYFVLQDLSTRKIREGKFYHFDSGIVNYIIDYEGHIGVPYAEWSDNIYKININ
jgi:hypothetical protein